MITITRVALDKRGRCFQVGGDAVDLNIMRGKLIANGWPGPRLESIITRGVLIDDTERRNIHAWMAGVRLVTIHDPEEVAVAAGRVITALGRLDAIDHDILTMGEKTRIAQAIRDMTTIRQRVERSMMEAVASGATEARS